MDNDNAGSASAPSQRFVDVFFGMLAPIERVVAWSGHVNRVELRILETDEAQLCSDIARQQTRGVTDTEGYLIALTKARIAQALVSVDGQSIDAVCKTLDDRLELVGQLPDTLLDALIEQYRAARDLPIGFLADMASDPNTDGTPLPTGLPSEPEESLTED